MGLIRTRTGLSSVKELRKTLSTHQKDNADLAASLKNERELREAVKAIKR